MQATDVIPHLKMTIVGASYQTILNRLMLQSCQLCDVAHDFRYDPRSFLLN